MKTRSNAISWVVVLMAASSLVTMICVLQMDAMVLSDVYHFNSYWWLGRVAFVMGWLNIIAAIAVQLPVALRGKEVKILVNQNVSSARALVEMSVALVEAKKAALAKLESVLIDLEKDLAELQGNRGLPPSSNEPSILAERKTESLEQPAVL